MPQTEESTEARAIRAYTIGLHVDDDEPVYLTLPKNPQSTTFDEPARTAVQQTLSAQYVEEWGPGLKDLSLEGHTGFKVDSRVDGVIELDGYEAFVQLRALMRRYYQIAKENQDPARATPVKVALSYHMWEEDEHWQVIPNGRNAFRRTRNAQSPLLFSYALGLVGVFNMRDDESLLRDDLDLPPELADMVGELDASADAWLSDLTALFNTVGATIKNLVGPILDAAKTVHAGIKKATKGVRQFIKGVKTGIKGAMAPVTQLVKTTKGMLKDISSTMNLIGRTAAGALGTLVGVSNRMRCSWNMMAQLQRYFQGIFGGPTGGPLDSWNRARAATGRC